MEKRALLAFGLILLIWVVVSTPFYQELMYGPHPSGANSDDFSSTISPVEKSASPDIPPYRRESTEPGTTGVNLNERRITAQDTSTSFLSSKQIIVESDLFRGMIDTRGGVITSWKLKKYRGIDTPWVELIPPLRQGSPDIRLSSEDGILEFSNTLFQTSLDKLILNDTKTSASLELNAHTPEGMKLTKKYTFSNTDYSFLLDLKLSGDERANLGSKYFVAWGGGLNITESDRQQDLYAFRSFAQLGDEVESEDLGSEEYETRQFSGETKWVGVRSKYFFAGIAPVDRSGVGCILSGRPIESAEGPDRQISAEIEMGISPLLNHQYLIYLGPVDYDTLASYDIGMEKVVDLGWAIIRPISIIILSAMVWMHQWISNYGVVIILLSIFIKILLYPLTHKSMVATQNMQALGPEMEKLKEKYKNDAQKLNREMMGLYKKHGVNPLGGCLPMVFQMPILYGLYVVFSSTIELRGAHFWLWIDDLSRGASSFTDPYIILPALMSVTMLIQSKMTMKDPRQAALVYMMPVMLFVFMYSLPSGLILYWTMINILTILQQYIQNRFMSASS